jgi:WD40 repeat protein
LVAGQDGSLLTLCNGIPHWGPCPVVPPTISTKSITSVNPKSFTTGIIILDDGGDAVLAAGICYSTVDMSIGLGEVISKNIQLKTPSCEKLCAVRHCNNQDVWVISHDWGNNTFTAWLVNSSGVGTSTSWSNAGAIINGAAQSAYGQLKASPDGKKLAACYYGTATTGINKVELYDFNPATGFVTNGVTLHNQLGLYGVEFSPDGRVLYAGTNQGLLSQWNLCAGTLAQVQASRVQISNTGPLMGSIQRGPDGKIYVARNNTSLAVINNPNVYGVGCNYLDLSIPLAGRAGRFGLPNFASFYTQEQFVIPNPVINCTTASFTNPIPNYTNCITQNVQYT